MKTLLSFFVLFSLIVFLLPLAALNPDKTENVEAKTADKAVSIAASQPIRQEGSSPFPVRRRVSASTGYAGNLAGIPAGIFFYFGPKHRSD